MNWRAWVRNISPATTIATAKPLRMRSMNLDRNIVMEASAGTGKPYTLGQTILQALFQKNLPMEALGALTFTKKAAGEMKVRIPAELQKIDQAEAIQEAWREWGQPLPELKARARKALETIDRA